MFPVTLTTLDARRHTHCVFYMVTVSTDKEQ